MPKFQRFLIVSALIAAAIAVPARAQSSVQLQQQLKDSEGAKHPPLPVHLNASLTHSIGSGTFVAGSAFNPTVSSALTVNPLLSWNGFTFLVNQSFGFEYTQSDYTTTPHQVELSDTIVGARYGRLSLDDLHLMFVPSVSVALPLSLASRNAGSAGGGSLGIRTIYSLNDYGLSFYGSLSTGGTLLVPALSQRFVNQTGKPVTDDAGKTLATVTCNLRNPSELNSYGCLDGGLPSAWRWGAGLGGSYSALDGAINVNLDLGFGQGFSVFTVYDRDQFTADNAVTGLVPRQSTSGNLSVTWVPVQWFFLTVGANSQQALWTNNCLASDSDTENACNAGTESNTHIRFPLWDFETPRDNNSSLYVDTTFSF